MSILNYNLPMESGPCEGVLQSRRFDSAPSHNSHSLKLLENIHGRKIA